MGLNVWKSDPPSRQGQRELAKSIQEFVCARCHLTMEEMLSRSRLERIVHPRMMAMSLVRQFTTLTLKEVGALFGGRDHGTVLWATERHQEMLCASCTYRDDANAVVDRIYTVMREEVAR